MVVTAKEILQTETAVERLQHHRPLFRGGMAPWPPLDPPVPLSVLRLRLIRIFVCVVICVIH